jgi:hypothetical protein
MILLIGGLFIGLVTILALGNLGWFAVVPALWAILMIAAGTQNLRGNKPVEVDEMTKIRARVGQPVRRGNETTGPAGTESP